MSNYKLTKNDLIVAMLNRGYTTDDVYALLNEVWAEAWAEGYEANSKDQVMRFTETHEQHVNPYRIEAGEARMPSV